MTDPIRHVLLFDIDGTLISTGGAGRRAMDAAFASVHGVADAMAGVVLSGKIDPMIYDEVCRRFRLAPAMGAFRETYLEHLAVELPRCRDRGAVMPGVAGLLRHLDGAPGVLLGLLTGNWRDGAYAKLRFYGLDRHFPFGAFGDDAPDRNALPAVAIRRAAELAGPVVTAATRFTVIGDTPRDIECALGSDCLAVAVATGEYPVEELAAYQPQVLLPDLADPAAFCRPLDLPCPA